MTAKWIFLRICESFFMRCFIFFQQNQEGARYNGGETSFEKEIYMRHHRLRIDLSMGFWLKNPIPVIKDTIFHWEYKSVIIICTKAQGYIRQGRAEESTNLIWQKRAGISRLCQKDISTLSAKKTTNEKQEARQERHSPRNTSLVCGAAEHCIVKVLNNSGFWRHIPWKQFWFSNLNIKESSRLLIFLLCHHS